MSEIISIFLLAMTPFGELRLAIPVGIGVYNLNDFLVYFVSVIGNLVPVVFFLLFLGQISQWLSEKNNLCKKFFNWIFEKTRKKYDSRIKKYGFLMLAIFVAIPLPLTGGWTASLIAFLFGIPFKKAFSAILLGVATAGLIVLFAVKTGIAIEEYYGYQILIGAALAIFFCWIMFRIIKKRSF